MKDHFEDLERFARGESDNAYTFMGAEKLTDGYFFRVWAPDAERVSVVGDFNFWNTEDLIMQKDPHGVWEAYSAYAKEGDKYKFYITGKNKKSIYKSDPYAKRFAELPDTSSMICDISGFIWEDDDFRKKKKDPLSSPMNIYEVHLPSWQMKENGELYSYREIAPKLIKYIKEMNYTHIEILPVTEYPYYGSWGYQVTGYFAPTHRQGSPNDLMWLINEFHKAGIGIILDWVPAHFPKDESGLYEFDGSYCYENADPLMNEHPEWNTRIFDYSRYEVISFLISSAAFWIREYHIDGIRVDAVASMLYLDYGKKKFTPNKFGGNYNLDAIEFLKKLNRTANLCDPDIIMIAEESTAFPMVTKPDYDGGLGFNFKWNMGWMNDMLGYISTDPYFRKGRHNDLTFSLTYAFSENFILPISHDEVVHGKCSLIEKMPGAYEEKFANFRVFAAYMISHPGKKLSFMGNEFAQFIEWDYKKGLDFFLLDYPAHREARLFTKELNAFYLDNPELWENDSDWGGFKWICADDSSQSIISFCRIDKNKNVLIAVINFCPVERKKYRIGLPQEGILIPAFTTERKRYGAKGAILRKIKSKKIPMHGYDNSAELTIPPLSATFYKLSNKEI